MEFNQSINYMFDWSLLLIDNDWKLPKRRLNFAQSLKIIVVGTWESGSSNWLEWGNEENSCF